MEVAHGQKIQSAVSFVIVHGIHSPVHSILRNFCGYGVLTLVGTLEPMEEASGHKVSPRARKGVQRQVEHQVNCSLGQN